MSVSGSPETAVVLDIWSVNGLLDVEASPLREPRIHPDVAEAIWIQALRRSKRGRFHLEFIVPPEDVVREGEVAQAVRSHFERQAIEFREELRNIFKNGRRSLGIGMLFVIALLAIAEGIPHLNSGRTFTALSESLVILAWVALWHPGELLLYAHFPVRKHRRLAECLGQAEVVLQAK